MGKVKYLIGEPEDAPKFTFEEALDGTLSIPTTSQFSVTRDPGLSIVFKGSFTVSGGDVAGGTVTSFDVYLGSTKLIAGSKFSIDAAELFDAIQADPASVHDLVYNSEPIKFVGSNQDDEWFDEAGDFNDKLDGKGGNDALFGGGGDDRIKGGDGNDFIAGDRAPRDDGFDKLSGGKGADVFQFVLPNVDPPSAYDKITDFTHGEDTIALIDFSGMLELGHLNKDQFHKGTSAADADQHVIYDKKTGSIYFDVDGSSSLDQHLVLKLKAGTKLDAGDFFVYPVLLN